MKLLLPGLMVLLLVGSVPAQNFSIAKDQARRASAATTAAAGGGQPAAPQNPAAGQPQPPPMDPAVAATLQNIASLKADLAAISGAAGTNAAAEQRLSLLNHLSSAAQGKKASPASVKKLANDLIDGLAGKKKIAAADQKLAQALRALSNAGRLTSAQQDAQLGGIKKILTEAEVPAEDVEKILGDLETLAAETK